MKEKNKNIVNIIINAKKIKREIKKKHNLFVHWRK